MSSSPAAESPPACLIDASIYIFRYYFSLPDNWFSQEGNPTAAVYGYTQFLLGLLQHERPAWGVACFDESLGSCFRNQIYPDYKSSRVLPDELLEFQLHACQEVTGLLGFTCLASQTYEADDLLGSTMTMLHQLQPQLPVALLTRDKDLGQLLGRPQDYLWDYVKPAQQQRLYREAIFTKFGVWPEQLPDYLALVGDAVDDIPGVPGIGAKTAQALLQWGGDLTAIVQRREEIGGLLLRGARRLPELLGEHLEQLAVSRVLAQIVTDAELPITEQQLRVASPDVPAFIDFCERMGLPASWQRRCQQLEEYA
ncbi:5'-3' exonuclease H3TH domain-containing protein [Pseudomaricurvus sp. HS19]|uniref:5'-3' exonuclease n=1 Tax=Pseudomaricurvus sp. HS19 TaxID=2692626 RepID=UPI00136D1E8C|nr:flap endonuclease [Pseudomaricurvus sp. HS19]